jgi:isoleucyl-tRNA synthetase
MLRLWTASSDYSGDIAGDDKILARVVDAYRRIRNTLRFLLANTSDFDPARDAVAPAELLEIDRWRWRAAQFQAEVLAHYDVRVPPRGRQAAAVLLGRPGRLLPGRAEGPPLHHAGQSLARRAQTALWQITQAMLRWMAPFLSFTAEEAWKLVGQRIDLSGEFWTFDAPDTALLAKWARIRDLREAVNKQIETLREQGAVGSSRQAQAVLTARPKTTRCWPAWGRPALRVHRICYRIESW